MVVRLRLARHGTRNNPFYHLVAIADHKPRDALPIEKLGEYDPVPRRVAVQHVRPHSGVLTSGIASEYRMEKRIEWNAGRIRYWLQTGAQPSRPVAKLLDKAGLIPAGKFFKGMFRHAQDAPPPRPGLVKLTPQELASMGADPRGPAAAMANRMASHHQQSKPGATASRDGAWD